MLACNCLNVIAQSETGNFLKVNDYAQYKLTVEEQQDSFFQLEHYMCTQKPDVTTRQILMQDKRQVGDWIIHRCINCDIVTHGINKYKGPSWTLLPTYLLTYQKIKELRSSKNFSKCFHIILPNKVDKSKMKEIHPCVLAEMKCHEGNFIKQFHQFKDKEQKACEDRITEFAEMQHSIVDDVVDLEKIFLEAMKMRILEEKLKKFNEENVAATDPPDLSCCVDKKLKDREIGETDGSVSPASDDWKTLKTEIPEEVFEMEDMDGIDDNRSYPHSQSEGSDVEDADMLNEDNGVKIRRSRSQSTTSIAKSLPINIPSFLSTHRNHASDDSDDMSQEPGKVDIAASIKALARSVHGEAVFGELPRPRFSSQI